MLRNGIAFLFAGLGLVAPTLSANTYWVDGETAVGIDDTSLHDGSENQPWAKITYAIQNASPGDIIKVRGGNPTFNGIYREKIRFSGWNRLAGGDANSPLSVVGVDGVDGKATIEAPSDAPRILEFSHATVGRNIVFANFILDGKNLAGGTGAGEGIKIESGSRDISILNCRLRNAPGNGILVTDSAEALDDLGYDIVENCRFRNLVIENCGNYGMYIKGDKCQVTNCTIRNNHQYGIHIYPDETYNGGNNHPEDNEIIGNRIWGNSRQIRHKYKSGILLGAGKRNKILNNIVKHENIGIRVSGDESGTVANNSITNCRYVGISIDGDHLINTVVSQNISWGNGANTPFYNYRITSVNATGGASYARKKNFVGNPLFAGGSLGLDPASPCRDPERLLNMTGVDILGYPRDSKPDYGAREYVE